MNIPEKDVRYVDLPDVSEIFVDSLGLNTFDGQLARMEFCITRLDAPNPPDPASARRYPACRLIMTRDTFLRVYKQLSITVSELEKRGIITRPKGN